MRYEKKYTFSSVFLDEIRENLYRSSYVFEEAFPVRRINTLYLDTIRSDNYRDNLTGLSNRSKTRLRWYTEKGKFYSDENTNFRLEVKLRKNFLGEKMVHEINLPNNLFCGSHTEFINYLIKNAPDHFKPFLTPCSEVVLGVSYNREYYQSNSIDLRCTLDSDLIFWDPISGLMLEQEMKTGFYLMEYGVMEMKFDSDVYNIIANGFEPLFQIVSSGRHSKYSVGTGMIHR